MGGSRGGPGKAKEGGGGQKNHTRKKRRKKKNQTKHPESPQKCRRGGGRRRGKGGAGPAPLLPVALPVPSRSPPAHPRGPAPLIQRSGSAPGAPPSPAEAAPTGAGGAGLGRAVGRGAGHAGSRTRGEKERGWGWGEREGMGGHVGMGDTGGGGGGEVGRDGGDAGGAGAVGRWQGWGYGRGWGHGGTWGHGVTGGTVVLPGFGGGGVWGDTGHWGPVNTPSPFLPGPLINPLISPLGQGCYMDPVWGCFPPPWGDQGSPQTLCGSWVPDILGGVTADTGGGSDWQAPGDWGWGPLPFLVPFRRAWGGPSSPRSSDTPCPPSVPSPMPTPRPGLPGTCP